MTQPVIVRIKDKTVQMEVEITCQFFGEVIHRFLIGEIHFVTNVADKDCKIFVNEDSKPYSIFDLIDAVHKELGGYEKTTKFSLLGI